MDVHKRGRVKPQMEENKEGSRKTGFLRMSSMDDPLHVCPVLADNAYATAFLSYMRKTDDQLHKDLLKTSFITMQILMTNLSPRFHSAE